jgi:hypothetical protein
MSALLHQRCLNHASREAVARFLVCRRFFCRECVTEHRGRMICATCIAADSRVAGDSAGLRRTLGSVFAAGGGFLLAWLIFYYAGMMLARVPSDFFK